ncbi:MAG TPA: hypothetical protein VG735_03820 [Caulobacterales bacterium]|nr:hypothetical protein [Caulobacterales bacterium]
MTETLTVPLTPEAAKRLRELAAEQGETVEAVAGQVLEDAAADMMGSMGDDEELRRRIDEYRRTGESVSAEDVHAWLSSLDRS